MLQERRKDQVLSQRQKDGTDIAKDPSQFNRTITQRDLQEQLTTYTPGFFSSTVLFSCAGTPPKTNSAIYVLLSNTLLNFGDLYYSSIKVIFRVRARMVTSGGSGDIRIYNATDAVELAAANFTSTSWIWQNIDISSVVPTTGLKELEIHYRGDGVKNIETTVTKVDLKV